MFIKIEPSKNMSIILIDTDFKKNIYLDVKRKEPNQELIDDIVIKIVNIYEELNDKKLILNILKFKSYMSGSQNLYILFDQAMNKYFPELKKEIEKYQILE